MRAFSACCCRCLSRRLRNLSRTPVRLPSEPAMTKPPESRTCADPMPAPRRAQPALPLEARRWPAGSRVQATAIVARGLPDRPGGSSPASRSASSEAGQRRWRCEDARWGSRMMPTSPMFISASEPSSRRYEQRQPSGPVWSTTPRRSEQDRRPAHARGIRRYREEALRPLSCPGQRSVGMIDAPSTSRVTDRPRRRAIGATVRASAC
jgi:hypothetical protein